MPLSKKKKSAIKREAEIGAQQQLTAKDALEFQKAYEEIIGDLNEKLENRLETISLWNASPEIAKKVKEILEMLEKAEVNK